MKIQEVALTIVFVAIITGIFSWLSYRQKQSNWEGELVKKKTHEDEDAGTTRYILIFSTQKGKKKVTINSREEYNKWSLGDLAIKKAGEYFPTKKSA